MGGESKEDNVEIKEEMPVEENMKKIYFLYDWIEEELIMASFDKNSILAKVGQDALTGVDVNDYCLKSAFLSELKDEYF